ncbi:hypothetical protein SAMD00023353_6200310 [Rosellinia necatrix]|uniref:Uncharacterized protein n=1 Tax=Rosellinia necatrix TaxID=77044 RepID=A0A1W2TSE4_ROSNE|nr:hypothetical protein SAMD00023353_6200310 [Rosellinia necatrix]
MAFNQPQKWSPEPYQEIIDIFLLDSTMLWPYPEPSQTYRAAPREESLAHFNQKYAHKALNASNRLTMDEIELVRRHLSDLFYEAAALCLRFQPPFSHGWTRRRLMPEPEVSLRISELDLWNKQTAVYFIGDSHCSGYDNGYTDGRLGAYIYREWHRVHDGRPNLQRYNFFAKALHVTKSLESFDVAAVIDTHRRLCNSMSARLNEEVIFRYHFLVREMKRKYYPQADIAKTWREHGFTMGHLFRAVLLVADENVFPETCPVQPESELNDDSTLKEIAAWLERLMPECRVLMVRTGDDAHLSRPVSFASLVDPSNSDQGDGSGQVDMVRVTVPVAIRFLHELQVQEEAAYLDLRRVADRMTEERESACREWVDSVMRHAEDVGMDGNEYTWKAVRRMWAARDGETFSAVQGDETRLFPLYSWTSIW